MTWAEEVAAAEIVVRSEFNEIEQALIEDVSVLAHEGIGSDYRWGAFFPWERKIEVYRPAFDTMPDPEHRDNQLLEVIRHEFWHALGDDDHPPVEHMGGR